jgi:hypothetical protein
MEQLTTLGIVHWNQDSAATSLAALKYELAEEKAAREKAQAEVDTLAQAIVELKNSVDGLATTMPLLE